MTTAAHTPSTRRVLRGRLAFLLVLAALYGGGLRAAAGDDRPNILFLFTDDHAYHALGAYGSRINETPNLDRLAREGMRFDRCYATNAICAPSRAVILTGLHSHRNGVPTNAEVFDGSQRTFPKLLRAAGYQTAMIGKWHLKSDPTGFDHWEVLIGQGPYYNPPLKTPAGTVRHTGYTTDVITDRTLEWLERGRDRDRPFLLMCQHKAPHRNWQPGPDHLQLYDGQTIPEPPTLFDDASGRASGALDQEMTIDRHLSDFDLKLEAPRNLTDDQRAAWDEAYEPKNAAFREAGLEGRALVRWKYQRYIKDYLRTIASVDDNVGRLLDWLDERGLAEDTVVIYSSDQGFFLGDHGWYDKRWMYEESARMPLLVRWPGVTDAGAATSRLVQNLDFAPTLLAIAGAQVPADLQGRSLVPLLRGDDPEDWRRSIYYHYYEFPGVHAVPRHFGVCTDRFKLIRYYQLDEWELFDLQRDPDELQSVHDDPAYASIRAELAAELERLQRAYGDTTPTDPVAVVAQGPLRRRAARVPAELALELPDDETAVHRSLDPSARPIVVGGWCTRRGPDGVLMAQGGQVHGWCLYLDDGRPRFGVRSSGTYREVAAETRLPSGSRAHVAGVLSADGTLRLLVDGRVAAEAPGLLLSAAPAEGLSIGRDDDSAVGPYAVPLQFAGELRDLRIYWGEPGRDELEAWSRPES